MNSGGGWLDRLIGWCFGILVGAIALYCAVRLIESILPALVVIIGVLTLVGVIIAVIVVFNTSRNRW